MKVLLLGATGRIGKNFVNDYFTNKYNDEYEMIIGGRNPGKFSDKRFEFRFADIIDIESLKKSFQGIDVVLNLAGDSDQDNENFDKLVELNVKGTYNILEAARINSVKRVIMASSVHAVKGYDEGKTVKEFDSPRPLNYYGATKAFIEAMCHVYYKKYGMSCIAIRIGAYVSDDMRKSICLTRDNYDYVVSQRDMAQLFHKSILSPMSLKYAVLSGSSDNRKKFLDLEMTKKLVGYKPEDDAHSLCEECRKKAK